VSSAAQRGSSSAEPAASRPRRATRRPGLVPLAVALGVLQAAACSGVSSRGLEPRPLTPLERGDDSGPPVEIIGEVGATSDMVERLARVFYVRIINRRFNSLSTFHDPALRELFLTPEAFADYFASFADALDQAHFDALRPLWVRLERLEVSAPDEVLVTVRLRGENALPLRWWNVELLRVDRWEKVSGQWRIIPGKL